MTSLSLATVLAESARRYPDKIAVVDGDQRVSYRDLWAKARAYGAALQQLGVRPGDAVALQIPNVVDFPVAYYGALAAGAVVVPVHLLLTADEVAYVLSDSRATLLVSHTATIAVGAAAAPTAMVAVCETSSVARLSDRTYATSSAVSSRCTGTTTAPAASAP